ncbi:DUF3592 domain-containing protein [Micromonospora purpureochromogenes]|uniref:DUF3592 domain-containing protein n=1 Tax=Micromonospora purpureochromogenes TaxID=47872 RepID=UPI0033F09CFD
MDGRWEQLQPRRRNLMGALIATTVGAAFMCCVALYNATTAIGLANLGITTDATVVQVDHFQRGSKVTVEFTAQSGGTVSAECTSCSSDLDEGDRVLIRYHPDNLAPGVEDAENQGAHRVALFALVAVAVLLSAAGLVGWRLTRDRPSV